MLWLAAKKKVWEKKLGDSTGIRVKKLGQRRICIVKCKALTEKKYKEYIFNLVTQ